MKVYILMAHDGDCSNIKRLYANKEVAEKNLAKYKAQQARMIEPFKGGRFSDAYSYFTDLYYGPYDDLFLEEHDIAEE